ncbi:MAG: type II toxin-antitoxin system RelE/ParE family toxin [Candidatus Accumulibacter sp.]|jgi:mRNA-degrading endonuclease RelE of RelBE toxin-antitoxin system|nr:type II toxin-antitoxin system RelE/ParE family toxin [Accumulibacter sp.]
MRYEFIESPVFSAYVYDYLSDEAYSELQDYLSEHPESGDIVRGSGGVRKIRWARSGRGKSAGVRICYYFRARAGQILLLTIYAKNVRESIPGHVLKSLCEIFKNE